MDGVSGGKDDEGQNLPSCGQAFSTTAAGLELLYSHLIHEHQLTAEAAGDAVDRATIKDRREILPVPLPRCS